MQDFPGHPREHLDIGPYPQESCVPQSSNITRSQNSMTRERIGERIIGKNKVWCNGRCFTGPEHKMTIVALAMIIIPSVIFDCLTVPWFGNRRGIATAVGILLPSLLLQTLSLASFFSTVCADPGIIPRERNPLNSFDVNLSAFRDHVPPKHQDVIINGHLFKLKYCSTCNIYRAPRTVHCSVCDNCVEKFDHHCPWTGNCIGKRNYRRFYFFICSTSLLLIFVMITSIIKNVIVLTVRISTEGNFANAFTSMWPEAWDSMVLAIFTFAILWFVIGLTAYHTYLIYANQTTYEHIKNYYEGEINPWNRGGIGNAHEILCTRSRPRYFDTRNLNTHHVIFEPKDIEANPPVDTQRNPESNIIVQSPSISGGRALVCGIEICSVAEVIEPPANGIETNQQTSQSSQQQVEIKGLQPQLSPAMSETKRRSRQIFPDQMRKMNRPY